MHPNKLLPKTIGIPRYFPDLGALWRFGISREYRQRTIARLRQRSLSRSLVDLLLILLRLSGAALVAALFTAPVWVRWVV